MSTRVLHVYVRTYVPYTCTYSSTMVRTRIRTYIQIVSTEDITVYYGSNSTAYHGMAIHVYVLEYPYVPHGTYVVHVYQGYVRTYYNVMSLYVHVSVRTIIGTVRTWYARGIGMM